MSCLSKLPAIAAIVLAASPAAAQEALSFGEALELAATRSPDLSIAETSIDSARHELKSARALRLPSLTVESNVFLWNESLEFDVSIPGMEPPPGMAPEPVTVRDRVTSTTTVTVVEPLSPQIPFGELIALNEAALAAARLDVAAARLDVVTGTAQAYLNVLLSRSAMVVAEANIEQFEAQLERAKVLQQGGVLQQVDLMRLESALAEARRMLIEARTRAETALDGLAFALGLEPRQAPDVVDRFPEQPAAPPLSVDAAVELALAGRPELAAARQRTAQADAGAQIAKADLFPNLAAVGSYQRNEGQGTFATKDAWFVGLTLEWKVWDWGRDWHEYEAARVQARQTALSADRLGDRLAIEVRARAREAQAAHEALGVARIGLAAAEEAFRIQDVRFREGAATTTDLLDSQSDVTRARLSYATARYAYFLSLVALARAVGESPADLISKV